MPSTGKKKLEQQQKRRALDKAQENIEGQRIPDVAPATNNVKEEGEIQESSGKVGEGEAPETGGTSGGLPPSPKMTPQKDGVGGVTPKTEGSPPPPPSGPNPQEAVRMAVARAVLGWFRFGGILYITWRIEHLKLPEERRARVVDRVGDVFSRKLGGPEAIQNCYQVAIVLEQEAPEYFKTLSTPAGQLGCVVGWLMDIKQSIDTEIDAAKVA